MSDWTPGRPRQPERPPRLELVDRCWQVKVLATGREMVCAIFRTDAGLEVRGGYRDELIISQHCRDLGAARVIAAKFKTKLLAEVGPVEELRAWLLRDVRRRRRRGALPDVPADDPTHQVTTARLRTTTSS